jgi:hypothetical protein
METPENKWFDILLPKHGMKFFWGFIQRLFILLAVLTLFIYVVIGMLPLGNIKKVDLAGNVIYFDDGKKRIYNFLFASSECWYDPGLTFYKGDVVTIRATGKYNTAIHHLVNYALSDTDKVYDWIGPAGIPIAKIKRSADLSRLSGLIDKTKNYGCLLVRKVLDNGKDTSRVYSYDAVKQEIQIEFKELGALQFIVNEPILQNNEEFRNLYFVDSMEDRTYWLKRGREQAKSWNNIVRNGNYTLWLEDNIGDFLITLEVEN